MEDKKVILEVKDLKKYFPLGKGKLDKNKKAVQNNEISPFAAAMSLLEQYFNNDR